MTNRKHGERETAETAKPAGELAAAELECVSGGKPASGVTFLVFTFKLVAVK
jgi:hypothetical protein